MAFKFSLQPVLEHRLTIEEKRQREYGEAQAKVEAARERKRQVEADIQRWTEEIRRGQIHVASGRSDLLTYARRDLIERWIASQYGRLELLETEIEMLSAQAEQCRQRLVKAMQDLTIMEKLREREQAEWRQAEERAERKFFDELAVRDFIDQQAEKAAGLEERIAG